MKRGLNNQRVTEGSQSASWFDGWPVLSWPATKWSTLFYPVSLLRGFFLEHAKVTIIFWVFWFDFVHSVKQTCALKWYWTTRQHFRQKICSVFDARAELRWFIEIKGLKVTHRQTKSAVRTPWEILQSHIEIFKVASKDSLTFWNIWILDVLPRDHKVDNALTFFMVIWGSLLLIPCVFPTHKHYLSTPHRYINDRPSISGDLFSHFYPSFFRFIRLRRRRHPQSIY